MLTFSVIISFTFTLKIIANAIYNEAMTHNNARTNTFSSASWECIQVEGADIGIAVKLSSFAAKCLFCAIRLLVLCERGRGSGTSCSPSLISISVQLRSSELDDKEEV